MEQDQIGSTEGCFEDCRFSSASDFLQALTPWSERFKAFAPGSVLFRGHGDSNWQLLPTAYRPEGKQYLRDLVFCPDLHKQVASSELFQAYIEANAVRCFASTAGAAGITVPGVDAEVDLALECLTTHLHDTLVAIESGDDNEAAVQVSKAKIILDEHWPAQKALQAAALAQHYGVPTRLLDWTYDARVAAYFAGEYQLVHAGKNASELAREGPNELCVWVAFLNRGYSQASENSAPGFMPAPRLSCLPNAGNSYLVSQSGTFTFDRYRYSTVSEDAYVKPLEVRDPAERKPIFRHLLRMRLPSREAEELMWLLGKSGIDACSVYPSLEGVSKALKQASKLMPRWRASS